MYFILSLNFDFSAKIQINFGRFHLNSNFWNEIIRVGTIFQKLDLKIENFQK